MFKQISAIAVSATMLCALTPLTPVLADTNLVIVQTGDGLVTVGDVSGDYWAADTIKEGIGKGFINGKGTDANGNIQFDPEGVFTRYEMAKLICVSNGIAPYPGTSKYTFNDLPHDEWVTHWAYKYVEALAEWLPQNSMYKTSDYGVVESYSTDFNSRVFKGAMDATREDVMIFCANALNFVDISYAETAEILSKYDDWQDISYQVQPKVSLMVKYGLLQGIPEDGKVLLKPHDPLTRAQAATFIDRATKRAGQITLKHFIYPRPATDKEFVIKGETDSETRIWATYTDSDGYFQEDEAIVDSNGRFTTQPIKTDFAKEDMAVELVAEKGSEERKVTLAIPVRDDAPVITITGYPIKTTQSAEKITGTVTGKSAIKGLTVNDGKGNVNPVALGAGGTFTFDATNLAMGVNSFAFTAENGVGTTSETVVVITREADPNAATELIIDTIIPSETAAEQITITGRAINAVEIVNTQSSNVAENVPAAGYEKITGRFTLFWNLNKGDNSLTVKAIGPDGGEVTKDLKVTRVDDPNAALGLIIDTQIPEWTPSAIFPVTGRAINAVEVVNTQSSKNVENAPVDGYEVATGRFNVNWALKVGENTLTIKAIGKDSKEETVTLKITYTQVTDAGGTEDGKGYGVLPEIKLSTAVPENSNTTPLAITGTVTNTNVLYFGSQQADVKEDGRFVFLWDLSQGENKIQATARATGKDAAGNAIQDAELMLTTNYNVMPRITNITSIPPETAASSINLNVQVKDSEKVYVNDKEVTLDADGYFTWTWNLVEGVNIADVVAVGKGTNNIGQINYQTYRDQGEPSLYLIGTEIPAETEAEYIWVNGRIRNSTQAMKLLANDQEIPFEEDGFFAYKWALKEGVNDMQFTIAGQNDRNTTLSISTKRIIPVVAPEISGYVHSFTYGNHTYYVFDEHMSWFDAQKFCESKGGYLATITSGSEQSAIRNALLYGQKDYYWLGGRGTGTYGSYYNHQVFRWVNGEKWTYPTLAYAVQGSDNAPWLSGQPCNNGMGDENCLAIRGADGRWNDLTKDGLDYVGAHPIVSEQRSMGFVLEVEN